MRIGVGHSPREQERVFSVSTIPSMGFIARFAIPVLNAIDVMSKIAVPVVSEPVPAVVGTDHSVSPVLQNPPQGCTHQRSTVEAAAELGDPFQLAR